MFQKNAHQPKVSETPCTNGAHIIQKEFLCDELDVLSAVPKLSEPALGASQNDDTKFYLRIDVHTTTTSQKNRRETKVEEDLG